MQSAVKYDCKLAACYAVVRDDSEVWYIPTQKLVLRTDTERSDAFTKMKTAVPTLNGGRWVTLWNGARVFIKTGFVSLGVRKAPKASARGANKLIVQDFKDGTYGKTHSKWGVAKEHVAKHVLKRKEYLDEEIYLSRALELAQKPVGGSVAGYARKDGKTFVRYDKATNEFVVAVTGANGGIVTLFHPDEGEQYYEEQMQDDLGEQKNIRRRSGRR